MEFLAMLAGLVTGAAAASLVVSGLAASQRRWLAAHCHQQITYWRREAEQARATAARLRGHGAWCDRPGHRTGPDH